MKLLAFFVSVLLAVTILAGTADLQQIHTVYLFPMAQGLDQHLANRLTNSGVFQVVTDPKKADAVFTDSLGEAFEKNLSELVPGPTPGASATPTATPANESDGGARPQLMGNETAAHEPMRPSYRAKGTIFLVNTRTHAVVWSTYDKPKNTSSVVLDRVAGDIVRRLQRALKTSNAKQ